MGDAMWVLRLLPALAVAWSVFLTGLMARRLGAGAFGQGLAALAAGLCEEADESGEAERRAAQNPAGIPAPAPERQRFTESDLD